MTEKAERAATTPASGVPSADASKPAAPTPQETPRVQSTALFRALNFELYVKPNIVVMAIGIVSVTSCVAYIAYWNATAENRKKSYMALNEQGELEKRQRMSKWDWLALFYYFDAWSTI